MVERKPLFTSGDLSASLRAHLERVPGLVDRIPKSQFLNASDDALVENVSAELHVEPLTVYPDRKTMDTTEAQVKPSHFYHDPFDRQQGVQGTRLVVDVPFTGTPELWSLSPSTISSLYPRGDVFKGATELSGLLRFTLDHAPGVPPEQIVSHLDQQLRLVNDYIGSQRGQVEAYNQELKARIRNAVTNRRGRLLEQDKLVSMLNIPLKTDPSGPRLEQLPLPRKLVRPLPPAPADGFKPEPGIGEEDYQHILSVIRHEGRTFEATPSTYSKLEEEELRDILLAHLNGHYQGGATGETFRKKGKTDIRVEDQSRSAFVGECKVWKGEKNLLEALDQLLGYMIWRDCKAALIIFNKNVAGFTELLSKVPSALASSPLCRSTPELVQPGEWQCRFASREDPSREVTVRVFAFNLYVPR